MLLEQLDAIKETRLEVWPNPLAVDHWEGHHFVADDRHSIGGSMYSPRFETNMLKGDSNSRKPQTDKKSVLSKMCMISREIHCSMVPWAHLL